MVHRTREIRELLNKLAGMTWEIGGERMSGWEASLHGLGTCAYQGTIPPQAVCRVVYLRDLRHPIIRLIRDGVPHVAEVQRYKRRLELVMRWLFGQYDIRDWLGTGYDVLAFRRRDGFPLWERSETLQMAA